MLARHLRPSSFSQVSPPELFSPEVPAIGPSSLSFLMVFSLAFGYAWRRPTTRSKAFFRDRLYEGWPDRVTRVVSLIPYLITLNQLMDTGVGLQNIRCVRWLLNEMSQVIYLPDPLRILMEIMHFLWRDPSVSFITFTTTILFVGMNKRLSRFSRYQALSAIFLDTILTLSQLFLTVASQFVPPFKDANLETMGEKYFDVLRHSFLVKTFNFVIFFNMVGVLLYAIWKGIRGYYHEIPYIHDSICLWFEADDFIED